MSHPILDNRDICIFPWTRLYANPQTANTCCQCSRLCHVEFQKSGGPWNGDTAFWNNSEFIRKRQLMLDRGKAGCGVQCSMLADTETPRQKLAGSYLARTNKPESLSRLLTEIGDGKTTIETKPLAIVASFGNICNARCLYCIQRLSHDKKTLTPLTDMVNLMRFADDAFLIHLIGGEIFALPRDYLDTVIAEVLRVGAKDVQTTTNGIGMTPDAYARYCGEGKLSSITVSLQTVDRGLYHYLNGVDAGATVLENLRSAARKNQNHAVKMVQTIVMGPTYRRLGELIDLCAECRIPTLHLLPLQTGAITRTNYPEYQIFEPWGYRDGVVEEWLDLLAGYREQAAHACVTLSGHGRITTKLEEIARRKRG